MGLFDFFKGVGKAVGSPIGGLHAGLLEGAAPGHVANRRLERQAANQDIMFNKQTMRLRQNDEERRAEMHELEKRRQVFEQMTSLPDALARYSEAIHNNEAVAVPMRQLFKTLDYPEELLNVAETMTPDETRMNIQQMLEQADTFAGDRNMELKSFGMGAQGKPFYEMAQIPDEAEIEQERNIQNASQFAGAMSELSGAVSQGQMSPQMAQSLADIMGQAVGMKAPTDMFKEPEKDDSNELKREAANTKTGTALIKEGMALIQQASGGGDAFNPLDPATQKEMKEMGEAMIQRGRKLLGIEAQQEAVGEPQKTQKSTSEPQQSNTFLGGSLQIGGGEKRDMYFDALPLQWRNKVKGSWDNLTDVEKQQLVILANDPTTDIDEVLKRLE